MCPNKDEHLKARGNFAVKEERCSALLLFIDQLTDSIVFCKCRNCKSIIRVETVNTVTSLEVLDANCNLEIDVLGKVVIK